MTSFVVINVAVCRRAQGERLRGKAQKTTGGNGRKMKAPYRVEVRVVEQKGKCDFGHQVGDWVRFDGEGMEGKICWHSLCSMIYKVHGFLYGAHYPWLEDKDLASHPCPDFKNPVIYQIRRFKVE